MKSVTFPYAVTLGDVELVRKLVEAEDDNVDARDSDGSTSLHLAIQSGNSSEVVSQIIELLLGAGASLEARNDKGHTPLHVASANGHFESVEQLIRAGACVDAEIDSNGFTSLFLAIKADRSDHDRTQIIRLLVEAGASLEKKDAHGFDPLRKAVALGKVNAVKQLILCGADVNAINDSGKSVLIAATRSLRNEDDALRIIQMLLEAGASPNIADCRGNTLLRNAVSSGNAKIVDQLIKAGADVEGIARAGDPTILQSVINSDKSDEDHFEVVKLLLEAGASLSYYDREGHNALQAAICQEKFKTVQQLILAGANVNKSLTKSGESCLHLVTSSKAKDDGCLRIVRLLLDAGAEIDARDRNQRTPLHCAVERVNLQIFRQLIEAGADVNAIDSKGRTILLSVILSSAGYKDRTEMVRTLLNAGASAGSSDILEFSPLHQATIRGYVGIVEQLVSVTADIQPLEVNDSMCLHFAVLNREERVADLSKTLRVLLDAGANLHGRNEQKQTPLHIAALEGRVEWVEAFVGAGAEVDAIDISGRTSLHLAIASDGVDEHSRIIRSLRRAGASVIERDCKNLIPLHCAVTHHKLSITELKRMVESYANKYSKVSKISISLESIANFGYSDNRRPKVNCLALVNFLLNVDMTHNPVKDNRMTLLEQWSRNGVDINVTTDDDMTSLHIALRSTRKNKHGYQIIPLLLEFGASVNAVDKWGRTPLMYALELGDEIILQQLIAAGADVKMTTVKGLSSLHYAILTNSDCGCKQIIPILIKAGAPLDIREKTANRTPLHCAIDAADVGAVKQLIRAGADVSATTGGKTGLHLALRRSKCRIIRLLLQAGASPNIVCENGETLLTYALRLGDEDLLQQLITSGENVRVTTAEGMSSLHYAILEGTARNCGKIVALLIKAGAPANTREKRKNQTPLHYAVVAGNVESVEQLIRAGADVNALDFNSMTCLHLIFYSGKMKDSSHAIVRLLLKARAKLELRDKNGMTPLFHAVTFGDLKLVGSLIDAGAEAEVSDNQGRTLLHYAVRLPKTAGDFPQMIPLLNKAGIFLESRDPIGRTLLMFAAADSRVELVEQLINVGADVNAVDSAGYTILFTMCESRFPQIVGDCGLRIMSLLIAAGAELSKSAKERPTQRLISNKLCRKAYAHYLKCKQELQLLRSSCIHRSITYYQILKRKKTYEYARNPHLVEQFKQKRFSELFPIYGEDLRKSFFAELDRQKLVGVACHGLKHILGFDHRLIHVLILENLDEGDLQNLRCMWWHQYQLCDCREIPVVP